MTDVPIKTTSPRTGLISRSAIVQGITGIVMLILAFAAIAASDVSAIGTHAYWIGLVVVFGLVAVAAERMRAGQRTSFARGAVPILLHWVGVFLAIELVYFFVGSGRVANADTGLTNGLILALGTYLAGVHGNWRLIVVGVAIGLAAAGAAFLEEYLWVMFGLAVLAVIVLVIGSRRAGAASGSVADGT